MISQLFVLEQDMNQIINNILLFGSTEEDRHDQVILTLILDNEEPRSFLYCWRIQVDTSG